MVKPRIYIAIDLKSFYASVECVERGLDPLKTNLVVADGSKTEKTICLAVSPSLKQYGISGRARLYEVISKIKAVNQQRLLKAPYHRFTGSCVDDEKLQKNAGLKVDFIIAPPRMAHYLQWSAKIHEIYLNYVSSEDIHVYSIDEVFIDATSYLKTYGMTARALTAKIITDVYQQTGITATGGIGTNLYLCKVAMDIVAKHMIPDENGVRIASLNEKLYRQYLWQHRPLTDFWRIGKGYARKLEQLGLYTMGDIAKCSVGGDKEYYNEDLLYDTFGVNAELLIDHAWGYESCTMADIKAYKPKYNSIVLGQVLSTPYSFTKARVVFKEMLDSLALSLVAKKMTTSQLVIVIGYDKDNQGYDGEMMTDQYGRQIPKYSRGTLNLPHYTSSSRLLLEQGCRWFDTQVQRYLKVRRISITACKIIDEKEAASKVYHYQLNLFEQPKALPSSKVLEKEKRLQEATLLLKKKYGKNSVLKALDLEEGATAKERNDTIGGHKA